MNVKSVTYMLMAQAMDRALAFWRNAFGFARRYGDEHWSEVDAAGASIAFHGGHDGTRNPTGLSIEVDDIEAAAKRAAEHGAAITMEPVKREGEGISLAELVDTEGNTFMLSQQAG